MERVTFKRGELTLVGNLYKPEGFSENEKYVALIVQGSATSVKEQMPAIYVERFVKEGFVCLAFDYSHYGESEGEPRQLESPDEKVNDLVAATDYLLSLLYVEKVCMVGICSSGQAAALFVAKDKRIAALATVAGNFATPDVLKVQMGEKWEQVRAVGRQAREHYETTGESQCITMYSETVPTAANYRPVAGAYDYYLNPNRGNIPSWKNQINTVSFERMFLADPVAAAKDITVPTIVVHSDGCYLPEGAKAFCAAVASEKTEYADGGGGHFDYYDQDAQVGFAVSKIAEFFNNNRKSDITMKIEEQLELMRLGKPYDAHTPEMYAFRDEVKKKLHQLNVTEYHTERMAEVTRSLFPNSAPDFFVEPPFHCDYGDGIYAAEGVFINFGAVILDGARVTIGRKTLIAPGVHIYTAEHPLNADERDQWETCRPVTIGERCWIGGHATICPGVTIGDRCVIAAGAVVTKDVPSDTLVGGVPAKVIRKLNGTAEK